MPNITEIRYMPDRNKYWIYVDSIFCCSIRERTFPALKLYVGMTISCDEIKSLENFHWKRVYGPNSWKKENVRLVRIKNLIDQINPAVEAKIVGFGAGTSDFIEEHPPESGKPDIDVILKINPDVVVLSVEVTGTEVMRPGTNTYWVRPDKLNYMRKNPDQDVWIALHYSQPSELLVFIKPDANKNYPISEKNIRGTIEYYVEFSARSPEVHDFEYFKRCLENRILFLK